MNWNFNINEAPQGRIENIESTDKNGKVKTTETFIKEKSIIASKCGKVLISHKLKTGRWNCLATDELPIAWQKIPPHPNELM